MVAYVGYLAVGVQDSDGLAGEEIGENIMRSATATWKFVNWL